MSDRFARIETLYHAARALPAEKRAQYLAQAADDDEIRREVESILAQPGGGMLTSVVVSTAQALACGTVLGNYRIVEQIGAGGMGEVYRAHDAKLGRDVALKVLPQSLASDRDRLARLEREARLLASLNHANVAHVYGLDESNGTRALVMELVEGETLAERIARGPIPVGDTIPISRQIASALTVAHDHGIIHRDLKPANIKLRPDGTVKVLDFGLAKAMDVMDGYTATEQGAILGTVAYMSPEQAAGKAVDRRTDLWAFGVVVMEMLTGRRVFDGESTAHVLSSVLNDEPDWSRLPANTPAPVRRLLRLCLAKDPARRWDSAGCARLELDDPTEASPAAASVVSDTAVVLDVLRRHWVVAGGTGLVVALLATAIITVWRARHASAGDLERVPTAEIVAITSSGNVHNPAISADGRFIASIRAGGITLTQLSGDVPQHDTVIVPSVPGRTYAQLTFSPDGNSIYYTGLPDRTLWRVALLGGMSHPVATNVWSAVGFSPSGKTFAFVRSAGIAGDTSLIVAYADGSHERVLATRKPPARFASSAALGGPNFRPSWSPDGKTLALAATTDESTPEIVLLDANNGTERDHYALETSVVGQIGWLDSERLLVETPPQSNVATSSRPERFGLPHLGLSVLYLTTRKWASITHEHFATTLQNFSLSASPDAAVAGAAQRTEQRVGLWLADGNGANIRMLFDANAAGAGHVTVNDSGAVWYMASTADVVNLYQIPSGGTDPVLVFADIVDYDMTPDAATVVVEKHDGSLVRMKADGSETTIATGIGANGLALSAARREVVYSNLRTRELYAVPLDGGTPQRVADGVLSVPHVSPAGDRVAFLTDANVVTVCDLPQCAHPLPIHIATNQVRPFGWAPDGRSLAFSPTNDRQNLWAHTIDTGEEHPLTHFDKSQPSMWGFAWSPDGHRLALSRGRFFDDLVLIKGLR